MNYGSEMFGIIQNLGQVHKDLLKKCRKSTNSIWLHLERETTLIQSPT